MPETKCFIGEIKLEHFSRCVTDVIHLPDIIVQNDDDQQSYHQEAPSIMKTAPKESY